MGFEVTQVQKKRHGVKIPTTYGSEFGQSAKIPLVCVLKKLPLRAPVFMNYLLDTKFDSHIPMP